MNRRLSRKAGHAPGWCALVGQQEHACHPGEGNFHQHPPKRAEMVKAERLGATDGTSQTINQQQVAMSSVLLRAAQLSPLGPRRC